MFEKRPIWCIILGLNVCVLIWLITVQEPIILNASTASINTISSYGSSDRDNDSGGEGADKGNYVTKHLFFKRTNVSNESNDEVVLSLLTTTSLNNSNNKFSLSTKTSSIFSKNNYEKNKSKLRSTIKTTTTTKTTTTKPPESLTLSVERRKRVHNFGDTSTSWHSFALPAEDFNQLIDLTDFKYLMTQPVCANYIEALILVHSAPANHGKRQLIRETWGSVSHVIAHVPLRLIFLLGAVENSQLQRTLTSENHEYGDMLQGSFVDDYRNMTYKHIMAFKWFISNCAHAQILIKVDDDVYVNTLQLLNYSKVRNEAALDEDEQAEYPTNIARNSTSTTTATSTGTTIRATLNETNIKLKTNITNQTFSASLELFHHPHNLLFCEQYIGSLVKRSYRSKWRVSFKEYTGRYYPPYCPGYAIIYSSDVVFRLYSAAQQYKYFWIDDVHITGVLAQQSNLTITTLSSYVLRSDNYQQLITGKTDLSDIEFLFAWHSISPQEIRNLWHLQVIEYSKKLSPMSSVINGKIIEDNHFVSMSKGSR
uniref:Hexosyltransferase n=1 Tax=Glossina pallidipes TaxID=7398 RepID=A0A1A9ZWJ2_GLOPL